MLRQQEPVFWTDPAGYRLFWTINKHVDVKEIGRQPKLFLNAPRAVLHSIAAGEEMRRRAGEQSVLIRSMVRIDDPDHRVLRALTSDWFLPANLQSLRERIDDLAVKSVDKMASFDGACDFANDIAAWFPLPVILLLLGLGPEDEPMMLRLTQELFGPQDPDTKRSDSGQSYADTVAEFDNFFDRLTDDRRRNKRDDLASVIANAVIDDKPISRPDANGRLERGAGRGTAAAGATGSLA